MTHHIKQVPIEFYPKNYSYSAQDRFETCPYAYYRTDILKDVKSIMGPEAAWGNVVHKEYEDAIKEGRYINNEELSWLNRYLTPLYEFVNRVQGTIIAEGETTFTKSFELTEKFAKGDKPAWWRTISDVLIFFNGGADIIYADWKTGGRKPRQVAKYAKQLRYAALALFIRYPNCQRVHAGDIWIKDGGQVDTHLHTRADLPKLMEEFQADAADIAWAIQHNNFPKKTGGLCKGWCAVSDCPHWTPKPEKN